jgi:hypothetical protein
VANRFAELDDEHQLSRWGAQLLLTVVATLSGATIEPAILAHSLMPVLEPKQGGGRDGAGDPQFAETRALVWKADDARWSTTWPGIGERRGLADCLVQCWRSDLRPEAEPRRRCLSSHRPCCWVCGGSRRAWARSGLR